MNKPCMSPRGMQSIRVSFMEIRRNMQVAWGTWLKYWQRCSLRQLMRQLACVIGLEHVLNAQKIADCKMISVLTFANDLQVRFALLLSGGVSIATYHWSVWPKCIRSLQVTALPRALDCVGAIPSQTRMYLGSLQTLCTHDCASEAHTTVELDRNHLRLSRAVLSHSMTSLSILEEQ